MRFRLVLLLGLFSLSAEGQSRLREFLQADDRASMQTLDLSRCKLTSLPSELADCQNLRVLDLSKNKLDSLGPLLLQLKHLEVLHLSKNQFRSIPQVLMQLPQLRELHLDQNPIDSLKAEINNWPALETLDLWDCEIKFVSRALCENKTLTHLDLRRNFLGTRDLEWLISCLAGADILSTWGCDCD